jgi:hypothetical protein
MSSSHRLLIIYSPHANNNTDSSDNRYAQSIKVQSKCNCIMGGGSECDEQLGQTKLLKNITILVNIILIGRSVMGYNVST